MNSYKVYIENFKKCFFGSKKINDQGFALAQVIFLIGLTSALSITIYRVNSLTVEQSQTINQDTIIDVTSRKMLTYLRSSRACMNTIAPLGTWDANSNGALDRPVGPRGATGAYDESLVHPTVLTNIRNNNNDIVYRACGTINTSNLAINNRCLVQASGAGSIYLKEIRLFNLTPGVSPPNTEINFIYAIMRQTLDEVTSTYVWEEKTVTSRALLTIEYDSTSHTIANCAYSDGIDLVAGCGMLSGSYNLPTSQCKSPSIGFPAFVDGQYGLKVNGNFRTTGRMSAQSMVVGAPVGVDPTANQDGTLFVTGGLQYGTVGGGVTVGGIANAANSSMTIAGSLHGAAATGSTTVGSLQLTQPVGATGNARRWLVTDGQMTLLNFPTNLDLSAPAEANRVVTTGWVRRAVARALASGIDVNALYAGLAEDVTPEDSSIEDNMVERFCTGAMMREVSPSNDGPLLIPGSRLRWSNASAPNPVSPARRICSFTPAFLINSQMCNGPNAASPRCRRVYANWICLGSGADRKCNNSFPYATVRLSECVSTVVFNHGGFVEYRCPNPLYVFRNNSQCCRMRAK
jgi:hypothetical protein